MPLIQPRFSAAFWLTLALAGVASRACCVAAETTGSESAVTRFEVEPRQGVQLFSRPNPPFRSPSSQRFEFQLRQVSDEQVDGIIQPEVISLADVTEEAVVIGDFGETMLVDESVEAFATATSPDEVFLDDAVEPLFEHALDEHRYWKRRRCCPMRRLLHSYACRFEDQDVGIGHERLAFAPFGLDVARPHNNVRLRMDSVYGLSFPDRSEHFWATTDKGPKRAERSVDYQDFRLYLEAGNNTMSTYLEVPFRILDPVVNNNTAGLADLQMGARTVVLDGKRWTISSLLKTSFKTGDFDRGLGVGYISMAPSLLANYLWNDDTILHGQIEYHIPLGGNRKTRGEVVRYGIGLSHVAYESDTWAIIPTFEVITRSYLSGSRTSPEGQKLPVDGETGIGVQPGVRFVLGPEGDLGLFEFGLSGEFRTNENILPESMLRLDFRWSF